MCANSKGKIFMSTLSRKLNGLFKENAKLRKRLSEAEAQIGQKETGNKDVLTLPSMKPIENSHLKHWNCVRRINGQIRLKEKRLVYVEGWKWEIDDSKKVLEPGERPDEHCRSLRGFWPSSSLIRSKQQPAFGSKHGSNVVEFSFSPQHRWTGARQQSCCACWRIWVQREKRSRFKKCANFVGQAKSS